MNISLQIVNLREHKDEALLGQVYTELYEKAFTDPSEVESLDQYATRLWDPTLPPPQPITHFFVAGTELFNILTRKIEGFLICESYRTSLCGLITFIVIDENYRGRGLARKLIKCGRDQLNYDMIQVSNGNNFLQAIFAEMHNPRQFFGSDIIDPIIRLYIMRKLGAHWVPIRYVQPELQPNSPRSRHLLMTAFPISDENTYINISSNVVKSFLFEFYRALGVKNPDLDSDYQSMISDLYDWQSLSNLVPELPTAIIKND